MREDERDILGPWLHGFAQAFGVEAPVERFDPGVPGAPDDLHTITFPVAFEPRSILGGIGHFRAAPALMSHMRRLGYGWDEAGVVRTAPTPSTFNVLLGLLGQPDAGFVLEYVRENSDALDLGPWLHRYLHGRLPIHVAAPGYYVDRHPMGVHGMRWHLTSLAHDLTVHAQNYHLVPHAPYRRLRERMLEGAADRLRGYEQPRGRAPMTLTYFLDNDFNRYCYAVWCRCRAPEDFAAIFERNFDQVLEVLEERLVETAAGLGDVRPGRSQDMAPLSRREFMLAGS